MAEMGDRWCISSITIPSCNLPGCSVVIFASLVYFALRCGMFFMACLVLQLIHTFSLHGRYNCLLAAAAFVQSLLICILY